MRFMGSKARIAKYILPIILKNRKKNQYYVEPFMGGCNIIDKVDGKRIGNDLNKYIVALYKALQCGWIPPDFISEEFYNDIKNNLNNYDNHLIGFVGFGCSFGGKFFGGYARGGFNSDGSPRMYSRESKNNLIKQSKLLKDVDFYNYNYCELKIPDNSIIYCDIPYKNTTKYNKIDDFNYDKFYNWCIKMKDIGHEIFVSEYDMPDYFKCVWEMDINNSIPSNKTKSIKRKEKLFII